mmetsp:Transcript_7315/g.10811  ORF Transcript_7315/g.10811 Transcript_7315/m.10811 type:complete len:142 (+) Transcript_7315:19-444(+)
MAFRLPRYIQFKTRVPPSPITRIDPKNLTPTDKLTLARSRIWGEIIGGNKRSGLSYLKKPLSGEGRVNYFKYAMHEMYLPFKDPKSEESKYIDEKRRARNSRKGKQGITAPSKKLIHVPKYERKRYLINEQSRKKKLGLSK